MLFMLSSLMRLTLSLLVNTWLIEILNLFQLVSYFDQIQAVSLNFTSLQTTESELPNRNRHLLQLTDTSSFGISKSGFTRFSV